MQKLTISLKKLGKKKIKTTEVEIEKKIHTLEDLLIGCVQSEVKKFNLKRSEQSLLPFLSPSQIQDQSSSGKIGFGAIENLDQADIQKSIDTAIQGFKDGLFLVFIDDQEITKLDQKISLNQESLITMIRMTFLTGTYW